MAIYLDCNATTPIEPRVLAEVIHYMDVEFGNAGSRTHEFGTKAKNAVQKARIQIAKITKASQEEVIFTSGATESNNMAILGLARYGEEVNKKHILSTMIEHKSVLEPLEFLSKQGFKVSLIPPTRGGWVEPEAIMDSIQDDTLLISVMHVNNETGVVQPIQEIANTIKDLPVFFHVDAAQGFGKDIETLQNQRIDSISISAHKIYGPKGIGALIARKRGFERIPLSPLMFGGGQERGLRPGTLPVHLIVGLGLAAELALNEGDKRNTTCSEFKNKLLKVIEPLKPIINADSYHTLSNVLNLSFPGLDSEAVIVVLKDLIAISNGSACTSQSYEPSHVLKAMGFSDEIIRGAIRISWCHMSEHPDWEVVERKIMSLY